MKPRPEENAPAEAEDVLDRSDPRWLRLREIIEERSLKRGHFTLSSGAESSYIFQLRQTTLSPEGAALLGEIILEYMGRHAIKSVGGPELGAVPIVASVAVVSHIKHAPVAAFFVRKARKEHGALERIDGHWRGGEQALMVDDVATSGASILQAVEGFASEAPDCDVRRALVAVDREEGAALNLARRNIQLAAIFKRRDFPGLG